MIGDLRGVARRLRREVDFLRQISVLPPKVALFQWRASRLASRMGDPFGPVSATRPRKLAALLSLAENRQLVVELGTGSGWTAISLLLAHPSQRVVSYDVIARPEREQYMNLAGAGVRSRLELIAAAGDSGPQSNHPVDLLYIDSSHDQAQTVHEVRAWWPVLRANALVVFDDFDHPQYPGVRDAVRDLALDGEERHGLFVHTVPRP